MKQSNLYPLRNMAPLLTLLFFTFHFSLFTSKAQTPTKELKFDSLVNANERYQKQDITKLKLLNSLAFGYSNVNPAKGIETGEQAIVLAQKLNNQLLLAEAFNNKGLNHAAKSDYPTAIELYEKALAKNKNLKNTFGIAHNTCNIGNIFRARGDYKKAMELFKQALTLFESIYNKEGVAICNNGLGNVCLGLSDNTSALDYYQKAFTNNKQIGNKSRMAANLNNIGSACFYLSDYPNALKSYQNALAINEQIGNKTGIAMSLGNLGLVYANLSDYPKALDYYQKALTINEQIGNKSGISSNLGNIGIVYNNLSDYPKALENYQKALAINEQMGNKFGISLNLGSIGVVYTDLSEFTKALESFRKALQINEQLGNKTSIASNLANIGIIYYHLSDYTKSMEYSQKAFIILEEIGNKVGMASTLSNIGNVYRDAPDSVLINMGVVPTKRYEKALECQYRALQLAQETGDLSRQKTENQVLSITYEAQGDYAKAHDAYKKYIVLRDSIESGEIKDKIERKTMQYEFDKKESEFKFQQQLSGEKLLRSTQEATLTQQQLQLSNKEKDLQHLAFLSEQAEKQEKENLLSLSEKEKLIQQAKLEEIRKEKEIQDKELALSQAEVQSKSQQRNAFIVGMILFLALSFFIYRNFMGQRKANKVIEAGNLELKETQSQLVQQEKLASLGALTAGIAHEIKNPLNFVNNFAELSNELIDEYDAATTEEEKNELLQIIKQNLSKINEHGKRADSIVKSMLEHSRTGTGEKQLTDLNKLSEEFLNLAYHGMRANVKDFNCAMEKHLDANLPKLNVVQQDISRVLLNLINNAFYAIKDKPDAKLTLSTKALPKSAEISIKDNGTGMSKAVQQKIFEPFYTTKPSGSGTGLGLSLSFDIIKAHGGKIEVNSEEGLGTEFVISLPA